MKDTDDSERRTRESFLSLIGEHLDRLYQFVGHELAYFEALGDLGRAELTTQEVVDDVLLRAYDEFRRHAGALEVTRGWLLRLAIEQIESAVRRSRTERARSVHIEDDVPETPPAEWVSTLGDEILDFYEPDEDLKLEDLVPDLHVPTPEQEAERGELRQCVNAALSGMPRAWRRAVLLRHVDGLTGTELAKALGMSADEARRILENAREYLRQRLVESGRSFREIGG